MYNPFRPRCTVDPVTRQWIDDRPAWLCAQFPDVSRRTVLPTPAFFPDPHHLSDGAVRRLIGRVCRYIDVDAEFKSARRSLERITPAAR